MSLLKYGWQLLQDVQRRTGVRWALTVIFALLVLTYFGAIWNTSSTMLRDRQAIADALRAADLSKRDEVAVQFTEQGTITVNGKTFGDATLAKFAPSLFNPEGRVASPDAVARMLLQDRIPRWAPLFLLGRLDNVLILAGVTLTLLMLAVWVGLSVPLIAVALVTGAVCSALALLGAGEWVIAVGSIAALLFCFALLVRSAALILGRATPVFAIASTVLREAVRLKIATFFVGVLLIAIPLLPLTISSAEPLRYQIQTFLSRSMALLFVLAACMTVFLSCATVAFEIRDKQIFQLMTKPVARMQYLLGKWLGVITLDVILVFLGGIATFTYVEYLQTRPAKDAYDQMAVREEVLVARQGRYPTYRTLSGKEARAIVERKLESDALLKAEIANQDRSEDQAILELAKEEHKQFLAVQRSINPGGDGKTYVFEELGPAKQMGAMLTLRYSFDIGRVDPHEVHPVIFKFANGTAAPREFVPAQSHILQIPPDLIDDKGRFEVTIVNGALVADENGTQHVMPGIGTMAFKQDAFEVLYKVDSFEWNFFRALAVQLLKLAFLAMFGVCAATVLSFPVACVLTFTVLAIGGIGPFLGMSLDEYYVKPGTPPVALVLQTTVKYIATAAEWMLRAFGETRPTALLVEGRLISWWEVLRTLTIIGVVWTAAAFAIGYAAFRRKELATYSGHQ